MDSWELRHGCDAGLLMCLFTSGVNEGLTHDDTYFMFYLIRLIDAHIYLYKYGAFKILNQKRYYLLLNVQRFNRVFKHNRAR